MSETQTVETPELNSTPTPTQPTLSVDDIKNAVKIIDFAAEQGAFKGWNVIEQVLLVRNRLNNFAKVVAPTPVETTDTSDVAETATPETPDETVTTGGDVE